MSEKKREIEVQGKTVEAAVAAGLASLGVAEDKVEVVVVDEGSRGLLGIGSRDAVVRLTLKTPTAVTPLPPPKPQPQPKPAPVVSPPMAKAEPVEKVEIAKETAVTPVVAAQPASLTVDDGDNQEAAVAQETLETLLDMMGVAATVAVDVTEPDDITGERVHILDVQGRDLRILIGPRGETLNALQYISRLMVGHKIQQRANFVIDVEGYRQRREAALSKLAERMAEKVLARKQPISLEPMPPNERRVIHMTLREHNGVYTESVGEGKRRKVRILPK